MPIVPGTEQTNILKSQTPSDKLMQKVFCFGETIERRIYAYVLIDNYYHLLVQTMDKKLQNIIHQLNKKHIKYYNLKYKRVGHVFQGRYKAIWIQDERYLISLIRYIHQNPVEAKICTRIDDYKWSGDIFYRKDIQSFIETEIPLQIFAKNRLETISKYKKFMVQKDESDYEQMCR